MATSSRWRTPVVLASVLLWLAASAPVARAASGVSCTYDGTTVAVTIVGEGEWGYYGTLNLARTAEGEVSVVEPVEDYLASGPGIVCSGGDGADPAASVSVTAAGEASLTLNVLLGNWTDETSIAVDRSVGFLYLGLIGTDGPDVIHTSDLPLAISYPATPVVELQGLGGSDDLALEPSDSLDLVFGYMYGGEGDDLMIASLERGAGLAGGPGDDTMKSSSTTDDGSSLSGEEGNDVLSGGEGVDSLSGDVGDDRLDGGDGDDYLYGGAGDDVIDAGGGNDWVSGEDGADVISGGDGDDVIDSDIPDWYGSDPAPVPGDDQVDGGAGSDSIWTWGGDDTIDGGPGGDVLVGGEGRDHLMGSDGPDYLDGGPGSDLLDGGEGDDYLEGADDDDSMDGGPGNDSMDGGPGDDVLHGADGDDALSGGYSWRSRPAGNDRVFGEAGQDLLFTEESATALLDGGADADACQGYVGGARGSGKYARVTYADCERAETYWAACSYSPLDGGAIEVSVFGSGGVVSLHRDPAGAVTVVVGQYEEAGPQEDRWYEFPTEPILTCAGGSDANLATSVIVNGAGSEVATDVAVNVANWTEATSITIHDPDGSGYDDYDALLLIGSDGADVIDGGALPFSITADGIGSLEIFGRGGDDDLAAGVPAGVGGLTDDWISIDGGKGDDHISGGWWLEGGDGDDVIEAGEHGSYLGGGAGDDVLLGGQASDGLVGGDGDDVLHGGLGDDGLRGGSGDDVLYGEGGDDYLAYDGARYGAPGAGRDLLDGGDGSHDYCAYYVGEPQGARVLSRVRYLGCELDWWDEGRIAEFETLLTREPRRR